MLTCQKDLFNIPEGEHYLNAAYMSPLMREVEDAGIEGIRRKRAPNTISPEDFFNTADDVRALFARLIGAPTSDRVAITAAASYGIATAARNLRVEKGQSIVVLEGQFPSNLYSWRRMASEASARLLVVETPDAQTGRGRRWNTGILEAISSDTAVVTLPHVHWADGTIFDLASIGRRCREVGAALIIDGTQSIGAFPFDFDAIRPDALVCAGYKWLMGPYGIGVAYFGDRFTGGVPLEENWISRKDSEHFDRLVSYQDDYQPGAIRYDVGERGNFILLPMLRTALHRVNGWGADAVQSYCASLVTPFVSELESIGCFIETVPYRASHLFGLRLPPAYEITDLLAILRERRIHVSIRGNAVRISPHVYNDTADIAALRDALTAFIHHRRAGALR